jgi:hypothetical protein
MTLDETRGRIIILLVRLQEHKQGLGLKTCSFKAQGVAML